MTLALEIRIYLEKGVPVRGRIVDDATNRVWPIRPKDGKQLTKEDVDLAVAAADAARLVQPQA